MKAFVTSIGESTTELCVWSLKRLGYDVELVQSQSSLWDKLKIIYNQADDDFLRVDADVVVNRNLIKLPPTDEVWWWQFYTYDWWKQDIAHGGVQYIGKKALPILREHIEEAKHLERPESYMFRLADFHNPRRCISNTTLAGLNGYNQTDTQRVKDTKWRRGQMGGYDFELAERLNTLL